MILKIRPAHAAAPISADPHTFHKLLGVAYRDRQVYSPGLEMRLRQGCEKLHRRGGINRRQLWLGALYRTQIRSAHTPPLTIDWIDGTLGFGLFTTSPLHDEAFIGLYAGEVRRRPLFTLRDTRYSFRYPTLSYLGPHYLIDALIAGNHTRFINHSDRPNVEASSAYCDGLLHIVLRTIRPVPAGSQLLMDYGPIYWRHRRKR
jgi:uncharacterized protein